MTEIKHATRKDFLMIGAGAICCVVTSLAYPLPAIAEETRASAAGKRINPYSVSFSGSRTTSEFSTINFRVELRQGIYDNAFWLWIRSSVIRASNYEWGSTVKLTTPYGTVSGLPYGSGDNLTVGSQKCTAAICCGVPSSAITVTYEGAAYGSHASKTLVIPAQSIMAFD